MVLKVNQIRSQTPLKPNPAKEGKKGLYFPVDQLMLPVKPIGNLDSLDFSETTLLLKV